MTARIFLLPTQYDIIDFRLGNRPENLLLRDFASVAERQAYEEGIEAVGDAYNRVEGLAVTGSKVSFTRHSNDPDADAHADAGERQFGTPAEAEAFCRGIQDAEGLMAPLLIDDTDDRFEQLLEWAAELEAEKGGE